MFEAIGARAATADDVRDILVRHNDADVFGWVEEILDQIEQRAQNHGTPAPVIELVSGNVEVDELAPKSPWILVVDGDLKATGDLDFATGPYEQSLLLVTGDVSARHFRFNSGAACYIAKRLVLSGCCFGDHGDESAALFAQLVRAHAILLDHVTGINAPELDAVVCSSEGWGLPMHVNYGRSEEHPTLFVPEVLDAERRLDLERAWAHAHGGGELFLPGVHDRLRSTPPVIDGGGKPR
ncbi:hypothetical protein AKJ09_08099 [Labilithrix luteola]|uniref:Uncharacterized protein n=1 Tax=Labilithrix luteola TaxID=1391654 RepID=A0A0K1Q6H2_9BACT|nr:hypothetical protein [Labilithrix luteola]AKV01436.1 hypothetical protein AKJ09_08099 [Labilithrix luteola]